MESYLLGFIIGLILGFTTTGDSECQTYGLLCGTALCLS
jgi:hypothetical protein